MESGLNNLVEYIVRIGLFLYGLYKLYLTSKVCWAAAKRKEYNWFLFMVAVSFIGLSKIYYLYIRNHRAAS